MKLKINSPGILRVGVCWGNIVVLMVSNDPNEELVILDLDPDETSRWKPGEHIGFQSGHLKEQLEPEEWKP